MAKDEAQKSEGKPGALEAWGIIREIIRTLAREDASRGAGSFASRAARAVVLSSLAGALAGFIPAFVAIGISAVAPGQGAPGGAVQFITVWLAGAPKWSWILASLVLVATSVSFGFIASRASANFSAEATATLRVAMMSRVLATSPRNLDAAGADITGAQRGKAAGPARPAPGAEVVKLAVLRDGQMASELIVATISNLPMALCALVTMCIDVASTGSALAAVMGVGVFLLSRIFASRASARVSAATAELNRSDTVAFAEIGEKVAHLEDLRLAGAKDGAIREVEDAVRATAAKRQLVARATAISSQTASLVATLAPLVVLLSLSATGRTVSPAEVARLLLALPLIIARLGAVDALRIALIEKRPVLTSVRTVLALPAHPTVHANPQRLDAVTSSEIVFDNVTFKPPGQDKTILDGVSFRVPAGSVVGLCGASGCGKSTLLRMLLRQDDPTSGRILVGGVELGALDPETLPALFGALAQGGKLLPRSIEDNVTLAARNKKNGAEPQPTPWRDLAKKALSIAQIPDLAKDEGLDRRFTPAPANLSGGEQRRVLLARAVASDAKILVLDEPEAGLPKATAKALFQAVIEELRGRSAVVVTHAPGVLDSTFNVVMDGGKVVDSGTHAELLERCELYRKITAEKDAPAA